MCSASRRIGLRLGVLLVLSVSLAPHMPHSFPVAITAHWTLTAFATVGMGGMGWCVLLVLVDHTRWGSIMTTARRVLLGLTNNRSIARFVINVLQAHTHTTFPFLARHAQHALAIPPLFPSATLWQTTQYAVVTRALKALAGHAANVQREHTNHLSATLPVPSVLLGSTRTKSAAQLVKGVFMGYSHSLEVRPAQNVTSALTKHCS